MFFRWLKKITTPPLTVDESISGELKDRLKKLFKKESLSSAEFFTQLEELFLTSDVSINTTLFIMQSLKNKASKQADLSEIKRLIREVLLSIVTYPAFSLAAQEVNIFFIFGINGVGKTTSLAKLASYYTQKGSSVIVAAADTYRAAAEQQLKFWMDSLNIPLVYHEGKSKPSAVLYDALDATVARKKNILMVDTAGRMHSREDLLIELQKLKKMIHTKIPSAKTHHLIVLDATTGQNALSQARHFRDAVGIDGAILSKMDSSGKGGVALSLANELRVPILFTGFGEKVADIAPFVAQDFVDHLYPLN